jgi:hypothetical protein
MKSYLEKLGFSKDEYTFPLLVHLFDTNYAPAEVSPQDWYLSAND